MPKVNAINAKGFPRFSSLPDAEFDQLLAGHQLDQVSLGVQLALQQLHRMVIAANAEEPVAQGLVLITVVGTCQSDYKEIE
jgi:hypothetical protein